MEWIHLTASMSRLAPSLILPETGHWLWTWLRDAFALAIAVALMPNHVHVLLASGDPGADRRRLARLLGHFGRTFDVRGRASEVADPSVIRGGRVLARQVRYIMLNPCRDGLASCPLAWRWSTHRDLVGAAVDPWVTPARLAAVFERDPTHFVARFHRYVSADPSTRVDGTALPIPAPSRPLPDVDVATIAAAATAALRLPVDAIRSDREARALFVALAFDQGWTSLDRLAALCECSPRTIRRDGNDIDPLALAAAQLCLGDARLR